MIAFCLSSVIFVGLLSHLIAFYFDRSKAKEMPGFELEKNRHQRHAHKDNG